MAKAQKQSATTKNPPAPVAAGVTPSATPVKAAPAPAAAAPSKVTQLRTGPTHEQIARRAYEIFLARGGEHGHAQEDWAQAERELALGRY